jgi:hypothetical protein
LDVISISTIEHIGLAEYGQVADPSLTIEALKKVVDEARTFLLTAPLGYNKILDNYIIANLERFWGTRTSFLARGQRDNLWSQVDRSMASRATYGPRDYSNSGAWANAIVVLERP